jgi:hypothetical protein
MAHPYAALCDDFYVNQRINVKMDLPMRRETVLGLFDRMRRQFPALERLRRYENEVALESREGGEGEAAFRWVGVRRTSVRSGVVNAAAPETAFELHRAVLRTAPAYLDLSALDVESVELLYGFDLRAEGNHDAIVHAALFEGSPLGALVGDGVVAATDCQPMVGVSLGAGTGLTAHVEVKTRSRGRRAVGSGAWSGAGNVRGGDEPLSVFVTVRRSGAVESLELLEERVEAMGTSASAFIEERVFPHWLAPLRERIGLGG